MPRGNKRKKAPSDSPYDPNDPFNTTVGKKVKTKYKKTGNSKRQKINPPTDNITQPLPQPQLQNQPPISSLRDERPKRPDPNYNYGPMHYGRNEQGERKKMWDAEPYYKPGPFMTHPPLPHYTHHETPTPSLSVPPRPNTFQPPKRNIPPPPPPMAPTNDMAAIQLQGNAINTNANLIPPTTTQSPVKAPVAPANIPISNDLNPTNDNDNTNQQIQNPQLPDQMGPDMGDQSNIQQPLPQTQPQIQPQPPPQQNTTNQPQTINLYFNNNATSGTAQGVIPMPQAIDSTEAAKQLVSQKTQFIPYDLEAHRASSVSTDPNSRYTPFSNRSDMNPNVRSPPATETSMTPINLDTIPAQYIEPIIANYPDYTINRATYGRYNEPQGIWFQLENPENESGRYINQFITHDYPYVQYSPDIKYQESPLPPPLPFKEAKEDIKPNFSMTKGPDINFSGADEKMMIDDVEKVFPDFDVYEPRITRTPKITQFVFPMFNKKTGEFQTYRKSIFKEVKENDDDVSPIPIADRVGPRYEPMIMRYKNVPDVFKNIITYEQRKALAAADEQPINQPPPLVQQPPPPQIQPPLIQETIPQAPPSPQIQSQPPPTQQISPFELTTAPPQNNYNRIPTRFNLIEGRAPSLDFTGDVNTDLKMVEEAYPGFVALTKEIRPFDEKHPEVMTDWIPIVNPFTGEFYVYTKQNKNYTQFNKKNNREMLKGSFRAQLKTGTDLSERKRQEIIAQMEDIRPRKLEELQKIVEQRFGIKIPQQPFSQLPPVQEQQNLPQTTTIEQPIEQPPPSLPTKPTRQPTDIKVTGNILRDKQMFAKMFPGFRALNPVQLIDRERGAYGVSYTLVNLETGERREYRKIIDKKGNKEKKWIIPQPNLTSDQLRDTRDLFNKIDSPTEKLIYQLNVPLDEREQMYLMRHKNVLHYFMGDKRGFLTPEEKDYLQDDPELVQKLSALKDKKDQFIPPTKTPPLPYQSATQSNQGSVESIQFPPSNSPSDLQMVPYGPQQEEYNPFSRQQGSPIPMPAPIVETSPEQSESLQPGPDGPIYIPLWGNEEIQFANHDDSRQGIFYQIGDPTGQYPDRYVYAPLNGLSDLRPIEDHQEGPRPYIPDGWLKPLPADMEDYNDRNNSLKAILPPIQEEEIKEDASLMDEDEDLKREEEDLNDTTQNIPSQSPDQNFTQRYQQIQQNFSNYDPTQYGIINANYDLFNDEIPRLEADLPPNIPQQNPKPTITELLYGLKRGSERRASSEPISEYDPLSGFQEGQFKVSSIPPSDISSSSQSQQQSKDKKIIPETGTIGLYDNEVNPENITWQHTNDGKKHAVITNHEGFSRIVYNVPDDTKITFTRIPGKVPPEVYANNRQGKSLEELWNEIKDQTPSNDSTITDSTGDTTITDSSGDTTITDFSQPPRGPPPSGATGASGNNPPQQQQPPQNQPPYQRPPSSRSPRDWKFPPGFLRRMEQMGYKNPMEFINEFTHHDKKMSQKLIDMFRNGDLSSTEWLNDIFGIPNLKDQGELKSGEATYEQAKHFFDRVNKAKQELIALEILKGNSGIDVTHNLKPLYNFIGNQDELNQFRGLGPDKLKEQLPYIENFITQASDLNKLLRDPQTAILIDNLLPNLEKSMLNFSILPPDQYTRQHFIDKLDALRQHNEAQTSYQNLISKIGNYVAENTVNKYRGSQPGELKQIFEDIEGTRNKLLKDYDRLVTAHANKDGLKMYPKTEFEQLMKNYLDRGSYDEVSNKLKDIVARNFNSSLIEQRNRFTKLSELLPEAEKDFLRNKFLYDIPNDVFTTDNNQKLGIMPDLFMKAKQHNLNAKKILENKSELGRKIIAAQKQNKTMDENSLQDEQKDLDKLTNEELTLKLKKENQTGDRLRKYIGQENKDFETLQNKFDSLNTKYNDNASHLDNSWIKKMNDLNPSNIRADINKKKTKQKQESIINYLDKMGNLENQMNNEILASKKKKESSQTARFNELKNKITDISPELSTNLDNIINSNNYNDKQKEDKLQEISQQKLKQYADKELEVDQLVRDYSSLDSSTPYDENWRKTYPGPNKKPNLDELLKYESTVKNKINQKQKEKVKTDSDDHKRIINNMIDNIRTMDPAVANFLKLRTDQSPNLSKSDKDRQSEMDLVSEYNQKLLDDYKQYRSEIIANVSSIRTLEKGLDNPVQTPFSSNNTKDVFDYLNDTDGKPLTLDRLQTVAKQSEKVHEDFLAADKTQKERQLIKEKDKRSLELEQNKMKLKQERDLKELERDKERQILLQDNAAVRKSQLDLLQAKTQAASDELSFKKDKFKTESDWKQTKELNERQSKLDQIDWLMKSIKDRDYLPIPTVGTSDQALDETLRKLQKQYENIGTIENGKEALLRNIRYLSRKPEYEDSQLPSEDEIKRIQTMTDLRKYQDEVKDTARMVNDDVQDEKNEIHFESEQDRLKDRLWRITGDENYVLSQNEPYLDKTHMNKFIRDKEEEIKRATRERDNKLKLRSSYLDTINAIRERFPADMKKTLPSVESMLTQQGVSTALKLGPSSTLSTKELDEQLKALRIIEDGEKNALENWKDNMDAKDPFDAGIREIQPLISSDQSMFYSLLKSTGENRPLDRSADDVKEFAQAATKYRRLAKDIFENAHVYQYANEHHVSKSTMDDLANTVDKIAGTDSENSRQRNETRWDWLSENLKDNNESQLRRKADIRDLATNPLESEVFLATIAQDIATNKFDSSKESLPKLAVALKSLGIEYDVDNVIQGSASRDAQYKKLLSLIPNKFIANPEKYMRNAELSQEAKNALSWGKQWGSHISGYRRPGDVSENLMVGNNLMAGNKLLKNILGRSGRAENSLHRMDNLTGMLYPASKLDKNKMFIVNKRKGQKSVPKIAKDLLLARENLALNLPYAVRFANDKARGRLHGYQPTLPYANVANALQRLRKPGMKQKLKDLILGQPNPRLRKKYRNKTKGALRKKAAVKTRVKQMADDLLTGEEKEVIKARAKKKYAKYL